MLICLEVQGTISGVPLVPERSGSSGSEPPPRLNVVHVEMFPPVCDAEDPLQRADDPHQPVHQVHHRHTASPGGRGGAWQPAGSYRHAEPPKPYPNNRPTAQPTHPPKPMHAPTHNQLSLSLLLKPAFTHINVHKGPPNNTYGYPHMHTHTHMQTSSEFTGDNFDTFIENKCGALACCSWAAKFFAVSDY